MTLRSDQLIRGFACLLSLFLLVRWSPDFIQTHAGDPSYTYSYHQIFLTNARYGLDVLHTGGPWSILYFHHYHPDTFIWSLVGQAIVALTIGLVVGDIAAKQLYRPLTRFGFVIGMLALLTIAIDARYFFLALAAIALMPDFQRQRASAVHAVVISILALSVLIKSSFFVVSGVVILMTALHETVYARKFPVHAIGCAILIVGLHLMSGQELSGLYAYTASIIEVGLAYPEFLSEQGSYWELVAFWFFALILATIVIHIEVRRSGAWGWVTSGAYAAIVFVAYKQGFMRQDGQHVIRAFCTVFTFGAFYLLLHRSMIADLSITGLANRLRNSKLAMAACVIAVAAALSSAGNLLSKYPTLYNTKFDRLNEQIADLWNFATSGRESFDLRHAEAVSKIRKDFPLPSLDGSLAIFASLQTVGIANPVDYRILPTTAAQLIWTPKLDAANTAFITANSAPRYIAGHLPFTNRQSGLAILNRYRPYGFVSGLYLLRHGGERSVTRTPLGKSTIGWGERLDLPPSEGGLLIAKISYKRTLWGAILNLLYQPAPAYLVTQGPSGETMRELIGRQIAEQGLLVSPFIGSVTEFAAMTSAVGRDYMSDRGSASLHLEAGDADRWLFPLGDWAKYFLPDITVEFERLDYQEVDVPTWHSQSAEMGALHRLLTIRPRTASGQRPELILTPSNKAAIELRKGRSIAFALNAGANKFEIELVLQKKPAPLSALRIAVLRDDGPPVPQPWEISKRADIGSYGESIRLLIDNIACRETQRCEAVISLLGTENSEIRPVQVTDVTVHESK